MININNGKNATFRPIIQVISGFKIKQLKRHDILFDMRRNEESLTTNATQSIVNILLLYDYGKKVVVGFVEAF